MRKQKNKRKNVIINKIRRRRKNLDENYYEYKTRIQE
jgi:hypothetical protein